MKEQKPCEEDQISMIIEQFKFRGLFDDYRRKALGEIETKPFYYNLRMQVKDFVGKFLAKKCWTSTLNKNEFRNQLKNEVIKSNNLNDSVDFIVTQTIRIQMYDIISIQILQYLEKFFIQENNATKAQFYTPQAYEKMLQIELMEQRCLAPPPPCPPPEPPDQDLRHRMLLLPPAFMGMPPPPLPPMPPSDDPPLPPQPPPQPSEDYYGTHDGAGNTDHPLDLSLIEPPPENALQALDKIKNRLAQLLTSGHLNLDDMCLVGDMLNLNSTHSVNPDSAMSAIVPPPIPPPPCETDNTKNGPVTDVTVVALSDISPPPPPPSYPKVQLGGKERDGQKRGDCSNLNLAELYPPLSPSSIQLPKGVRVDPLAHQTPPLPPADVVKGKSSKVAPNSSLAKKVPNHHKTTKRAADNSGLNDRDENLSVSSVHTSDLSSFDDQISISSSDLPEMTDDDDSSKPPDLKFKPKVLKFPESRRSILSKWRNNQDNTSGSTMNHTYHFLLGGAGCTSTNPCFKYYLDLLTLTDFKKGAVRKLVNLEPSSKNIASGEEPQNKRGPKLAPFAPPSPPHEPVGGKNDNLVAPSKPSTIDSPLKKYDKFLSDMYDRRRDSLERLTVRCLKSVSREANRKKHHLLPTQERKKSYRTDSGGDKRSTTKSSSSCSKRKGYSDALDSRETPKMVHSRLDDRYGVGPDDDPNRLFKRSSSKSGRFSPHRRDTKASDKRLAAPTYIKREYDKGHGHVLPTHKVREHLLLHTRNNRRSQFEEENKGTAAYEKMSDESNARSVSPIAEHRHFGPSAIGSTYMNKRQTRSPTHFRIAPNNNDGVRVKSKPLQTMSFEQKNMGYLDRMKRRRQLEEEDIHDLQTAKISRLSRGESYTTDVSVGNDYDGEAKLSGLSSPHSSAHNINSLMFSYPEKKPSNSELKVINLTGTTSKIESRHRHLTPSGSNSNKESEEKSVHAKAIKGQEEVKYDTKEKRTRDKAVKKENSLVIEKNLVPSEPDISTVDKIRRKKDKRDTEHKSHKIILDGSVSTKDKRDNNLTQCESKVLEDKEPGYFSKTDESRSFGKHQPWIQRPSMSLSDKYCTVDDDSEELAYQNLSHKMKKHKNNNRYNGDGLADGVKIYQNDRREAVWSSQGGIGRSHQRDDHVSSQPLYNGGAYPITPTAPSNTLGFELSSRQRHRQDCELVTSYEPVYGEREYRGMLHGMRTASTKHPLPHPLTPGSIRNSPPPTFDRGYHHHDQRAEFEDYYASAMARPQQEHIDRDDAHDSIREHEYGPSQHGVGYALYSPNHLHDDSYYTHHHVQPHHRMPIRRRLGPPPLAYENEPDGIIYPPNYYE